MLKTTECMDDTNNIKFKKVEENINMMYLSSGVPYPEYLILNDPEEGGVPAREHAVHVFVPGQLVPAITVIGLGEVGIRAVIAVATIGNVNVSTTPETRTTATVTAYQFAIPLGHKLLPHVQREEEGPAPAVVDGLPTAGW